MEENAADLKLKNLKTDLLKISDNLISNSFLRFGIGLLSYIIEIVVYGLFIIELIIFFTLMIKGNASIYNALYPEYNSYSIRQIDQLDMVWNGLKAIIFLLVSLPTFFIAILLTKNRKKVKLLNNTKTELNKIIKQL